MTLLEQLQSALKEFRDLNAFCISDQNYTYGELANKISNIQATVKAKVPEEQHVIGLIMHNDLETYASIFALWFEGKAYVPINPNTPESRNLNVIEQAEIKSIIDSNGNSNAYGCLTLNSKKLNQNKAEPEIVDYKEEQLAYILFTSGTTGIPKGVPITHNNLEWFMVSFWGLDVIIAKEDRCLQMFDLTFDLSVISYLAPLLKGACVYTVATTGIKYLEVLKVLTKYKLNFALMVPSVVQSLRPYFKKINLPELKYSMFCGEALPEEIALAWSVCIPNAKINNVYGPTEFTIFCTDYPVSRSKENLKYHGILSIGKAMKYTEIIIVNDQNEPVSQDEIGELCLSGPQMTKGYWKNKEANAKAFFFINTGGAKKRFYKTGDLCRMEESGHILYQGRKDFQAKVQGHRIELSEIEFYVKKFIQNTTLVIVLFHNKAGHAEIGLAIEGKSFKTSDAMESLKEVLPHYMIPTRIMFFERLPLNSNGKTDRKQISNLMETQHG